jgi:nuclear pore complex protein Nup155
MNGKVWSIAEANAPKKGKHPISDIASNLIDEHRKFLVLTDSGLSFFTKQQPIDILHQLLLNYDETKAETFRRDLQVLVNQYGQTQVCAMCLGIICVERGKKKNKGLYTWMTNSKSFTLEIIGHRAKQVFFDYGGNPSVSTIGAANNKPTDRSNVNYSGKHNGLALYFSRLVSDVWKMKVFEIM